MMTTKMMTMTTTATTMISSPSFSWA